MDLYFINDSRYDNVWLIDIKKLRFYEITDGFDYLLSI